MAARRPIGSSPERPLIFSSRCQGPRQWWRAARQGRECPGPDGRRPKPGRTPGLGDDRDDPERLEPVADVVGHQPETDRPGDRIGDDRHHRRHRAGRGAAGAASQPRPHEWLRGLSTAPFPTRRVVARSACRQYPVDVLGHPNSLRYQPAPVATTTTSAVRSRPAASGTSHAGVRLVCSPITLATNAP
jgi:hypothetical protein